MSARGRTWQARALLLAYGALGLAGAGDGSETGAAVPRPVAARPFSELTGEWSWQLPEGLPLPRVPETNPMGRAKVELGRRLFYDRRLSGPGNFACADCHRQELAFTDGRHRAVGATGERHRRGAMSLANVAYNVSFNWASAETDSLEEQMLVPMFGEDPVELGLAGRLDEALGRLTADAEYRELFRLAFPGDPAPIRLASVVAAIAAFERTLISGDSPWDRYVFWGEPLPEAAERGRRLFFSERLACGKCHGGFNLSGPVTHAESGAERGVSELHNTALYDVDGRGAYPEEDRGLLEESGEAADMGRFRAPTLRNVAVTAPYMHDGSVPSLDAVLDHYAAGGRSASSPRKSSTLTGFTLSPTERRDLLSFLAALTDETFLTDPRLANPFAHPE